MGKQADRGQGGRAGSGTSQRFLLLLPPLLLLTAAAAAAHSCRRCCSQLPPLLLSAHQSTMLRRAWYAVSELPSPTRKRAAMSSVRIAGLAATSCWMAGGSSTAPPPPLVASSSGSRAAAVLGEGVRVEEETTRRTVGAHPVCRDS